MRKFDYRAARFAVDLPVRLVLGDQTLTGRCREISVGGMKVELPEPLPANSRGVAHIRYQDIVIEVGVRAARSGSAYRGFKFEFDSDEERDEILRLIDRLATEPRPHAAPVLALLRRPSDEE